MRSFQLDQDCSHQHHLFCIYFCTNICLGCSLSKKVFDIHEIVAPASNRDIVLFIFIATGKSVAYFMLLNLISIISSVCDSLSEFNEESRLLSGLLESLGSLISFKFQFCVLDVHACPIISLTWWLVLCELHVCLSE